MDIPGKDDDDGHYCLCWGGVLILANGPIWIVWQNFAECGPSLYMICRVDDLRCVFVLAHTLFALNTTPAEDPKQPER